ISGEIRMYPRRNATYRINLAGLAVLAGLFLVAPGIEAQAPAPPGPGNGNAPGTAVTQNESPNAAEGPQTLHLLVGRSIVISSPTRIKRISIADPTIAEALVVSPYQVLVNG